MPTYNRGKCACCASHVCNPVSFTFVELKIHYEYSMMGSTWYTFCVMESAIIEVTHLDGTTEIIDATASIQLVGSYTSNARHSDNQGWVTVCGKTAQWRVMYNIPVDSWEYTAALADASSVTTGRFQ